MWNYQRVNQLSMGHVQWANLGLPEVKCETLFSGERRKLSKELQVSTKRESRLELWMEFPNHLIAAELGIGSTEIGILRGQNYGNFIVKAMRKGIVGKLYHAWWVIVIVMFDLLCQVCQLILLLAIYLQYHLMPELCWLYGTTLSLS